MILAVTKRMRPTRGLPLWGAALLTLLLAGCGGYKAPSQGATTTGLKKRVLLSNQFANSVIIVDAQNDKQVSAISVFGADKMVTASGITAVIENGQSNISVINKATEQAVQAPILPARAEDVAVSTDGKTIFAAVHNSGVVDFISSDGTINSVNVPSVSRLVLSPNGSKLLAFSDNPQSLAPPNANAFFVIEVGSRTVTARTGPSNDQPFTGVFNASETQAFILSCGAECGGTAANVTLVNFSTATPTFSAPVPVSGATVGVLNSSNLYVAGTPASSLNGTLQTINTGTLGASAPVSIPSGLHLNMRLASNGRLFVGSRNCALFVNSTTGNTRGCLAIFNTSTSAVVIPELPTIRNNFDVTGILPISNRNVVYVCESGELDIYDTNTNALTPTQVDVQGKAIDVVQIDP